MHPVIYTSGLEYTDVGEEIKVSNSMNRHLLVTPNKTLTPPDPPASPPTALLIWVPPLLSSLGL